LTIVSVPSPTDREVKSAASESKRLLYERSFPWSFLVRVLAVPKLRPEVEREREPLRERSVTRLDREPPGDGGVVGRGPPEDLGRQAPAVLRSRPAVVCVQLGDRRRVVRRVAEDRDGGVVLGRRPEERRASDVDLLDDRLEGRPRGDRLLERVEVHRDEVDRPDPVLLRLAQVRLGSAFIEDPPENLRVQRLDPSPENLGTAGQVAHRDDVHPRVGQRLGGSAGRDDLEPVAGEGAGELQQSCPVGD